MIIPETDGGFLASRQFTSSDCPSGYSLSGGECRASGWYYWGRWVLAAIVVIFFIALFVAWSCINNRRRRRQGLQPRYGTGWMPGTGQPQYGNGWFGHNKGNQQQQPPPPQYTPEAVPNQYTGQTFNSNEGYYGHHNNDIPLQQPTSSYYPQGGDPVYQAPTGPPPAKS